MRWRRRCLFSTHPAHQRPCPPAPSAHPTPALHRRPGRRSNGARWTWRRRPRPARRPGYCRRWRRTMLQSSPLRGARVGRVERGKGVYESCTGMRAAPRAPPGGRRRKRRPPRSNRSIERRAGGGRALGAPHPGSTTDAFPPKNLKKSPQARLRRHQRHPGRTRARLRRRGCHFAVDHHAAPTRGGAVAARERGGGRGRRALHHAGPPRPGRRPSRRRVCGRRWGGAVPRRGRVADSGRDAGVAAVVGRCDGRRRLIDHAHGAWIHRRSTPLRRWPRAGRGTAAAVARRARADRVFAGAHLVRGGAVTRGWKLLVLVAVCCFRL